MKRTFLLGMCVVALTALASGHAIAGSVLIGGPGDAGNGNQYPLGGSDVSDCQQVYDAALFPTGSININSIDFFNNNFNPGSIATQHYDIYLSTTSKAVNGLAFGADSSNRGADFTLFFSGILGGVIDPVTHEFSIAGTPFSYDPSSGNLLLEIISSGGSNSGTVFLDARNGTFGTDSSRSYNTDAGGNFSNSWGLVTQFDFTSGTSVPEPSSMMLMAIGGLGVAVRSLRRRFA